MANTLLDFVMSLVRDPEAAARYAADPAQAIADADLNGVTSVDVDNLIPVVSESLSVGAATGGLDAYGAEPADNVWASGAATAAFDAFGDHVPFDTGSGGQVIHAPPIPNRLGPTHCPGRPRRYRRQPPRSTHRSSNPCRSKTPCSVPTGGSPSSPNTPIWGDHGDDLSGLDIFD